MTLTATQKKQRLLVALGLYSLFCAFSPGRITTVDVSIRLAVTRSLWESGSVFVDDTFPFKDTLVYPTGKPGGTSFYGIGQSLVFIPFDFLGATLARAIQPADPKIRQAIEWAPLLFGYAPLVGLLIWAALTSILGQLGLTFSQSLMSATLGSLSTIGFVYTTQVLQEEALLGALLLTAVALLFRWQTTRRHSQLFIATLLATFCPVIRLNSVFALIPLAFLAFTFQREKQISRSAIAHVAAATILSLAIFILFAQWRFGSPFSLGYDQPRPHNISPGGFGGAFSILYPISVLFGPGKGLFWLSPLLILFPLCFFSTQRRLKIFSWGLVIALLISVVFHSTLNGVTPDGAESWGTRFQVHLVCLMLIPCGYMLATLWNNQVKRSLLTGLLILSVSIQVVATLAPESLEYCLFPHNKAKPFSMVSSWEYGQLRSRLVSLWDFFLSPRGHKESPIPPSSLCTPAVLATMTNRYIPNYWGPAYSELVAAAPKRKLLFNLWCLLLTLAGFLFHSAIRIGTTKANTAP